MTRPRWDTAEAVVDGEKALIVLPALYDDDEPTVREGIARRRITSVTGRCPCGAVRVLPNRAQRRAAAKAGRIIRVEVVHENDCPATDATLGRLISQADR